MKWNISKLNLGSKDYCFKILANFFRIIYYKQTSYYILWKCCSWFFTYLNPRNALGKNFKPNFYLRALQQISTVSKLSLSIRNNVSSFKDKNKGYFLQKIKKLLFLPNNLRGTLSHFNNLVKPVKCFYEEHTFSLVPINFSNTSLNFPLKLLFVYV